MQVDLPVRPTARFDCGLPAGRSITFRLLLFARQPTAGLLSGFHHLQGTNINPPFFLVDVYALVTSDHPGAVQVDVSDILGQQVDGASVRLHNDLIQADVGPFNTDTNGLVTITNLEEGSWNWQVVAPGCSANAGTVTILADQTVSQAVPRFPAAW